VPTRLSFFLLYTLRAPIQFESEKFAVPQTFLLEVFIVFVTSIQTRDHERLSELIKAS